MYDCHTTYQLNKNLNQIDADDAKEAEIQRIYEDIHLTDDELIIMLDKFLGNKIDCFAIKNVAEIEHKVFNQMQDAISDFIYKVAENEFKENF